MCRQILLLFSLFLASHVLSQKVDLLENSYVERIIDVASQLVRTTAKISVENKGSSPVSYYYFAVDSTEAEHLSFISATVSSSNDRRANRIAKHCIRSRT